MVKVVVVVVIVVVVDVVVVVVCISRPLSWRFQRMTGGGGHLSPGDRQVSRSVSPYITFFFSFGFLIGQKRSRKFDGEKNIPEIKQFYQRTHIKVHQQVNE